MLNDIVLRHLHFYITSKIGILTQYSIVLWQIPQSLSQSLLVICHLFFFEEETECRRPKDSVVGRTSFGGEVVEIYDAPCIVIHTKGPLLLSRIVPEKVRYKYTLSLSHHVRYWE